MGWTSQGTLPATVVTDASVAGVVPSPLTKAAIEAIIAASGGNAINVKDAAYGALGNGTHDDTANINAAFAAVDQTKNRTIVYIPAGTYMINGVNLSAPEHNTRFIDAGLQPLSGTTVLMDPNAILKVITNSSPSYTVFYIGAGKKNITIRGGQLLGDRATHDYATETDYPTFEFGYGITTRGATNVTVDNVKISGMIGDCIVMGPIGNDRDLPGYVGATGRIINCDLSGARRNNISLIGVDWALVENCTITGAGTNDGVKDGTAPRMGIDLEWGIHERTANVTIRNNRFVGNKNGSVENYNGSGVVIHGNFMDTGIVSGVHADADCIITNNVLVNTADTTGTAINVAPGTPGKIHSTVTDNMVIGFGTGISIAGIGGICEGNYVTQFSIVGIQAYQAQDVSILGNNIFDPVSTAAIGITFSAPYANPSRLAAKNNTISNVNTGILVTNSAIGVVVEGNIIKKSFKGIAVGGGCSVAIKNNYLDLPGHSLGQDVDISYGSTSKVLIEGNTIRNSSTYSIQGQGGGSGGYARIIRNYIEDSTSSIAMLLTDGTHWVIDNIISVNRGTSGFYAIYIGNAAVGCRVIGNTGFATGAATWGTFVNTSSATGTPASVVFGNKFDGATVVTTHASDTVGENFSSVKSLASLTGAQTLTNKRITPRVVSTGSTATLTVDADANDIAILTAQAAALTVAAPTGTPTPGQLLHFRIKDDGTARAITWNSIFRGIKLTLPATTIASDTLYVTCRANLTDSKWDVISVTAATASTAQRVVTTTTASTLDIDASVTDVAVRTGQAAALTINAPTGSPVDGQLISIRITDNATARALTFNSIWRSLVGTLPTTTVVSTPLIITARYNSVDTKWDVLLVTTIPSGGGGGAPTRGQYVRSGGYIGASGNGSMSVGASNGYYRPLYVKKGGTLTTVKINVTIAAGAGGLVQVALYPHNPTTGLPVVGAPTYSTLAIDTTSTGTKSTSISWAVSDDTIYWIYVGATVSACTLSAITNNTADDLLGASSSASSYIGCFLDWNSGGLTGPPSSPDPRIAAGQIGSFPSVSFGS